MEGARGRVACVPLARGGRLGPFRLPRSASPFRRSALYAAQDDASSLVLSLARGGAVLGGRSDWPRSSGAAFLQGASMTSRTVLVSAALLALGVGTALGVGQTKDGAAGAGKVRIGTYDNRSIAVAYAASRHNPVKEKMAAYARAKAAGDRATVQELETWGERHQRLLHFQGFGRVPVGDLLEPVKDRVQELARRRGLAAVSQVCDYAAGDVELVDITEDLVKLYDPSEKALAMAREVRSAKPVDLVRLAELPAKP
jgi:hypothetical protein